MERARTPYTGINGAIKLDESETRWLWRLVGRRERMVVKGSLAEVVTGGRLQTLSHRAPSAKASPLRNTRYRAAAKDCQCSGAVGAAVAVCRSLVLLNKSAAAGVRI